ncbi:MAG: HPr kinase/phosphatase C-terminal domain-containing protein [Acetobacter sp.]|nr:HPr kinase/phosphatase C-terminal domain-containing protein [Acetobacter sp.]
MLNIHATLISFQNHGILFIGESGAGKSDIALRMIMDKNALLVADDRVNLECLDDKLYGSVPQNIEGLLEIRNVGIGKFPFKQQEKIDLCIELCADKTGLNRLPEEETVVFLGVSITKLKLYPFDCSILCKIIAKLNGLIETIE